MTDILGLIEKYKQRLAHTFWIEEGCPNGDALIDTTFGKMPLKEFHWMRADMAAQFDLEIIRDMKIIDPKFNAEKAIQELIDYCGVRE